MIRKLTVIFLSVFMCMVIAGTALAGGEREKAIEETAVKPITIMTTDNKYAPRSYAQGLPVWKIIEEKTGTKISWVLAPSAQYEEMLNIRMAAAEDLPDIIHSIWTNAQKWGDMGLLVDIMPLIEKYSPPNIMEKLDKHPEIKSVVLTPEGKMYRLFNAFNKDYMVGMSILIRSDWLKKLNLKEPATSEEFVNVMKRFRDEDMNGSGKPDEYLLVYSYREFWKVLSGMYGLHLLRSEGFYPDKDGKMQCEWITPKAKELYKYMNMLYEEQILHPEFLSANKEKFIAILNRNMAGAGCGYLSQPYYYIDLMKESVPEVEWIGLPALKGPFGDQMVEQRFPLDCPTSISKDADQELAINFLDFFWSHEGQILNDFGIKGETYVIENGKYKFTDMVLNNPDGLIQADVLRSYGAGWNFARWYSIEGLEMQWSTPNIKYCIENRKYNQTASPHTLMTYSKEEQEIVNAYKTDMDTFIDENVIKFILGEKDIDEFDQFVETLKNMGIDKLIQVYQQQYDRYLSSL